jgi:hypothetical protein
MSKFKDFEIVGPNALISGSYMFEKYKVDWKGDIIEDSKITLFTDIPNLITDVGITRMVNNSDFMNNCYLGSGSSSPTTLDTSLASYVGVNNTTVSTTISGSTTVPYYTDARRVYRFNAGNCTGNISEVGVGNVSNNLFSRSLIKDINGNPTTITKLHDEVLDISYIFRFNRNAISDVNGTITFTGNKGGTYDYIARYALVTTNPPVVGSLNTTTIPNGVYSGDIGTITTNPSGTSSHTHSTGNSHFMDPYIAGSNELNNGILIGLNNGNFAGGVRSCMFNFYLIKYQIQFTPAIPKTAEDELRIYSKFSWARS